jgi:hypothetical protein
MNRYFSIVFIPTLLFLIAFAVILPFIVPQEQRVSSSQVYRAIQRIRLSGST